MNNNKINNPISFLNTIIDFMKYHRSLEGDTLDKVNSLIKNWKNIPSNKRTFTLCKKLNEVSVQLKDSDVGEKDSLSSKINKISKQLLSECSESLLLTLGSNYHNNPIEAFERLDINQLEGFIENIDTLEISKLPEEERLKLYQKLAEVSPSNSHELLLNNFHKLGLTKSSNRMTLCKSIVEIDNWSTIEIIKNINNLDLEFNNISDRLTFYEFLANNGSEDVAEYIIYHIDEIDIESPFSRFNLSKKMAVLCKKAEQRFFTNTNVTKMGLATLNFEERLNILKEFSELKSQGVECDPSKVFSHLGFIDNIKNLKDISSKLNICSKIIKWGDFPAQAIIHSIKEIGIGEATMDERLSLCGELAEMRQTKSLCLNFKLFGFMEDINTYKTPADRLKIFHTFIQKGEWSAAGLASNFSTQLFLKQSNEDILSLFSMIIEKGDFAAATLAKQIKFIQGENFTMSESFPILMKLAGRGHAANFLASKFITFGFEVSQKKERFDLFCKILQHASKRSTSKLINEMRFSWLYHAPLQDRLAIFHLLEDKAPRSSILNKFFWNFKLFESPLPTRIQLLKKILLTTSRADDLLNNFGWLGTTIEKREIFLRLLTPPHFFHKSIGGYPFISNVEPLINILTLKNSQQSNICIAKLEEFINNNPKITEATSSLKKGESASKSLLDILDNVKGMDSPQTKFQLTQWLASCAILLFNREANFNAALQSSGILEDIFNYRSSSSRIPFTDLLWMITTKELQEMPNEAKEKKWSKISWIILQRMEKFGFSTQSVRQILSQINSKSSSKKVFVNPVRYNHLLQLLLKLVEGAPYRGKDTKLIADAILKILEPVGSTKKDKESISIQLQMMSNIFSLFGKNILVNCLDKKKDFAAFFREKLNEMIEIDEIKNFGEAYQKSFGSFRDPVALFTYIRTVRGFPEVLKALSFYVNAVLKEDFPKIRYNTDLNPHLKMLFDINKNLKEKWLESAEESEILESIENEKEIDYTLFFKNKILIDEHLEPNNFPLLRDYINGTPLKKVNMDDAKNTFQLLAIQLCKGEIKPKDFVTKVKALNLELGEFENDLQTLEPKLSYGRYTIKESDDPCDLLLIGTEIGGSCQRVNGNPSLNKCLVSYMMNGEIRPIVVKKDGRLIARRLLRLLWDKKNKTPVLLLERLYSNVNAQSVENEIIEWAIEKAKNMQIPLITKRIEEGVRYQGEVEFLGGFAPYVYSDASGGVQNSSFKTEWCNQLYNPLKK